MNEWAVMFNELALERRPMAQGIAWFDGLLVEEQVAALRPLSHYCIQARATSDDGPEAIRRVGLRATTPRQF